MKVILNKINQAVKQLGNQLGNRRCSSANGLFTSEIVGAVTSLILLRKNVGRRSPVTITSLISMLSLGLISLAMPIMFSSSVSATQSTITMSVASSIAIDVLPTTNGNFVSSSTSDTIVSVMTDNYTGYHLGIAASAANSTALSYTDNNSVVHTIPSISSSVSATNYADDTFATSNNLNNTWGFRPSKYNSTDNTDYLPIPSSTTTTTLDATNSPNASTANTYNIAIGARVDLNQAPGSYTNTFVITAIANAVPYTITYNANTGSASTDSAVSNMPANVTNGTTYADTVSLSSTTPTRTGYDFTGWCIGTSTSSNVTTTAGVDSCSSTTISAGGNITLDQTSSSNNFYLYAMWKKGKLYFQGATLEDCGQTMYDNRGTDAYKNVAYTTATIDNLCWVTRNLDLPGGTTLTSSDSNLNGSITSYTLPASSTTGFNNNATAHVYNSGSTTCSSNSACYSYYSYAAATAGTNPSSGAATSDICPKGWRLPTSAELTTLTNTYTTGVTLTQSPFLGVYAGVYNLGWLEDGGTVGSYWSSTASNSSNAYHLDFYSGSTNITNYYKSFGYSIRCVKAPSLSDVTYMQDVTADIVANTADGATATLTDKRDEKTYTVAKINGQLWMTANLALGKSTTMTLTPDDTNISSNYTLPARGTSGTSYDGEYVWGNDTQCTSSSTTACAGYYSYAAATAGTNPSSGAASSDICPKGWRLPTRAEFNTLVSSYGTGAKLVAAPFLGVYAGVYNLGWLEDGGTVGSYWSSTASSSSRAYYLLFDSGSAGVTNKYVKYYGLSIRCVAKS